VGTRPNFIKVMKLRQLLEQRGFEYKLLHTGQHFDDNMSRIFFEQLQLGKPDFYLGISGGTNNEVVGRIIKEADSIIGNYRPDMVIVPGDVNSTFACAFAAASYDIPVAHIESGLRSFDRTMPEERNRILTDHLSSLLFVTEPVGVQQLQIEGVDESKIKLVGNTIVDALLAMMPLVNDSKVLEETGISGSYCLVTFHRPVNVDARDSLAKVVEILNGVSEKIKVVFPVHPRTRQKLKEWNFLNRLNENNVILTEPKGYIDFLKLLKESSCVISDSGGIQVETSFLDIPCFTVRSTTELKITLEQGTNTLVDLIPVLVVELVDQALKGERKKSARSYLWDGNASERIADVVQDYFK
jgi:UDP-N-acetylglucosamine 2-epimerase (non-hydrolysing)